VCHVGEKRLRGLGVAVLRLGPLEELGAVGSGLVGGLCSLFVLQEGAEATCRST